jgi:hypothetical protein
MIMTPYRDGVQVNSAAADRDNRVLQLAHNRRRVRALLALPIMFAVCGCSSNVLSPDSGWFAKPLEFTSRPSWLFYSDGREPARQRPVGPEDFVSADGQCAAPTAVAPAAPPDAQPNAGEAANVPPPGPALSPTAVGLDMTECEVIRRAGHTGAIQIGNNARGERSVVMTYTSGPSPGIYRFTAGRLTSIERVAEPEPPPKPKRPARPQSSRTRT